MEVTSKSSVNLKETVEKIDTVIEIVSDSSIFQNDIVVKLDDEQIKQLTKKTDIDKKILEEIIQENVSVKLDELITNTSYSSISYDSLNEFKNNLSVLNIMLVIIIGFLIGNAFCKGWRHV